MRKRPSSFTTMSLAAALTTAFAQAALAAPFYNITDILVPPDQFQQGGREARLKPRPIWKPHDSRTAFFPTFWTTSNERTGCAGITTLTVGGNQTLKNVIIDEPGVAYASEEAGRTTCVGTIFTGTEPPEGTPPGPEDQFPPGQRFNPKVCLPIVLPPGQTSVSFDVVAVGGAHVKGTVKSPGPGLVCAPLGAERHPRHPHGITFDVQRNLIYQVIEHSGLRWNANRTRFQVANTTDEESGFTLQWNMSDPKNPKFIKGFLNGHGAHEVVVNSNNGLVFQGNHEDSPGVTPTIWVDVINPFKKNPYGFIDTGLFNAIQGVDVDHISTALANSPIARAAPAGSLNLDVVYGATHVGEKVFAFDGSCVPQPNPPGVKQPPPPPGYTLPPNAGQQLRMGWNCILWWTDIRPATIKAVPELATILGPGHPAGELPKVLHQHNLAADREVHRAFSTIHSIHDAEHTGLEDEEPPPGTEEDEAGHHFMARYVAEVDQPDSINPVTKKASGPVRVIDLSHGFDILKWPNADTVLGKLGLNVLLRSFVHAHFIWVDPDRNALLVTGEHTGNLAVVDLDQRKLQQVIPITRKIPRCVPPPPPPGETAEEEEPHVHGVTAQFQTGTVYVTDEGEHCFYESATVLVPK